MGQIKQCFWLKNGGFWLELALYAVYAQEFICVHVAEILAELQIVWFEAVCWHHANKLYVLVICQHPLGLIQPVAMKGCLILALFVVASVLEHIVKCELLVFVTSAVPLIIKAQYVDLVEFLVRCQFQRGWPRAPAQAGLEPAYVILRGLALPVLMVVVAPHFVVLGIVGLRYLQDHLGVHSHEIVGLLRPVDCVAGEYRAVAFEIFDLDALARLAVAQYECYAAHVLK